MSHNSFFANVSARQFSLSANYAAFFSGCVILLSTYATPVAGQNLDPTQAMSRGMPATWLDGQGADKVPSSVAGEKVGSATVDPLMTRAQEAGILEQLWQFDDTNWRGLSIEQVVREIGSNVPVFLNLPELDLLGVDPADTIGDVPPGRLVTRLLYVLQTLDLTMLIRRGALEITSRDSADADPVLRIYDVEPISHDEVVTNLTQGWQAYASGTLAYTIEQHIDPDSWVTAGGTNSITPVNTITRRFLVVSAPSETQWKVAKFLDVLNRSQLSPRYPHLPSHSRTEVRSLSARPNNSLPRARERVASNRHRADR